MSFGLPFPSNVIAANDMPAQITSMIANTARPCRLSPTMRPNMKAKPNGNATMAYVSRKLLNGPLFSNGCAEFMLKNPPPLVPSCLIEIWLAAGPPGITCSVPSTVLTVRLPWKFWMTPWLTSTSANTNATGTRMRVIVRVRSTQKLPSVDARRRARPRMKAARTAMPTAADVKLWTASPSICERLLIVTSPAYDCQLVLVVKLTAVSHERWCTGPAKLFGLSGSEPWNRSSRYSEIRLKMLNPMTANAYVVQRCSCSSSTRQTR